MASSSGTYCDICQSRHISKAAEEYCPVCEEALCSDCKDHHKLAKATKTHQVISIDEYNKLPVFIREIKQQCDEHGDKFEFFCPTHNELCCKRCITTTHNECKECKVIEDFVDKYSKSSAALDEYEQTLKDVGENIQTAIVDRKYNLEEFKKQKQSIEAQIKEKKTEIIKHFDNLEAKVINELSAVEGEKTQNVKSVIEKLEKNKNKNIQLREDVDAMKKYGSNIQVFMGTTQLQQAVSSQEKFVRSLQNDESLRFVNLECSISEELNGITTRIRSFGTVTPISSTTRGQFNWKSDKSAQILKTPTYMNSVDNINTKLICNIDVNTTMTITSCVVGKYVILSRAHGRSGSKGCVLQYDTQGKHLKEIEIESSNAFDILFIDSETVAVTGGDIASNMYIVDVATLKVKRIMNVGNKNWIYGATYQNESIIGCTNGKSIKGLKVNVVSGKTVRAFALSLKNKYEASTYLASDNNLLYHSDNKDESVTCYDLGCNIIWSFKNTTTLRKPRSVCLDSNSNVYVAGSGSNNVVVISSDGLHSKQLLGPNDGIQSPHAIHYDKSSKRLLVVNENGPAFLYQTI